MCKRLLLIKFLYSCGMKRTTILDLAKLLSLNPSTISRALNDHPDIRPETRNRVKEAAKTFQYRPNLQARFFRQKNSGLVALILPELNMFFIPGLMDGVNAIVKDANMSVIIFVSDNSAERESEIVDHCLSWMVKGVLLSLAENTTHIDHLVPLEEAGIPVVLLDKIIETNHFSTLTIDDRDAAYQAVSHLASQGKKTIMGLFGPASLSMTRLRMEGFQQALTAAAIPFSTYDMICAENSGQYISSFEDHLRSTPYDALFVMSDELLMQVIPVLYRLSLFPSSLSIVAISDGIVPYQLYPAITHVRHSGFDIGKAAASLLLDHIENKKPAMHIKLPVFLKEENSVF